MIKKLQIAFLFIVPIIFLYIGLQFDRTKYGTDPESAYLMNGLNIATGKAVGHFDNPGTTVQVYSSVVLRITHFLRFNDIDLETDVLQNSEYYIEVLRKSLIVFNACILLLLGVSIFLMLQNFWAALLLQISPFMSITLIEELYTKVAPEPLLFSTVAILIVLIIKYYSDSSPESRKYAMLFGLLSGFGLATKMTFLPMLIIPFIVLSGIRNKWLYVFSVFPSFILFTLPAAKGYLHMANWFLNLGTHTGTYGQGSAGLIDPAQYFNAFILIAKSNIALVVVLAIGIIALMLIRFAFADFKASQSRKEFYILLAVMVAIAGSILMVAKHYHSNHYLFPALSLSGFALVLIFMAVNSNMKSSKRQVFRFSLPAAVILVIAFSLTNIPTLTLAFKGYRMSNQSTDDTFAMLDRDYKEYVKVYYYPVSFNEYSSLRWGNTYSRLYSSEKLMELFPGGLFYNAWEKSFQFWETSIPPVEFVKKYGGKILLVGGPRTYEELIAVQDAGLKLKKLSESRVQVVYEIDTAKSAIFKEIKYSDTHKWRLINDFETFSDDNQWIIDDDGMRFSKNTGLTKEKPRSGNFSYALPSMDTYAMEYELRNVKPGQIFIISIWRYGGDDQASVVVSSKQADMFYAKSKGITEKDQNGWGKLFLTINVPETFTEDKLKVYLWNHGNSPAWFDDLEIIQYK